MYAVIRTGGKQYRVSAGTKIKVEQLSADVGSEVVLDQVLFVGNPDRAPSQCKPQAVGPNGSSAADGMATILANELFDAIVDPNFTAWYDRFGLEPADKCAWNFGATYTATNGARANIRLGGRDYLLQQLWVPDARGYCTLGATATP